MLVHRAPLQSAIGRLQDVCRNRNLATCVPLGPLRQIGEGMSAPLTPAAEDEQLRNVRAFMFERFRMVGDQIGRTRYPRQELQVDRLRSLARAVRHRLLLQVVEADLHTNAYGHSPEGEMPISQEMRQRDLALIMVQANVNTEMAALAYLEARGDLINAIMSLDPGSAQRGELEAGLQQRMAQLGLRVTDPFEGMGEMSEERREALADARRAFQEIASQRRAQQAAAPEAANMFVDGAPIVSHQVGGGKSLRAARLRGVLDRQAIRSEMEALEEQVEACTIDENTYNEKAMELKDRYQQLDLVPTFLRSAHITSHYETVMEMRDWLRQNAQEPYTTTPPFRGAPEGAEEPLEEVD